MFFFLRKKKRNQTNERHIKNENEEKTETANQYDEYTLIIMKT